MHNSCGDAIMSSAYSKRGCGLGKVCGLALWLWWCFCLIWFDWFVEVVVIV